MVCPRCVESVDQITDNLRLPVENVALGSVTFKRKLTEKELQLFDKKLQDKGFGLVEDHETELVTKIKVASIEYVSYLEKEKNPEKFSSFISSQLNHNYAYLSHLFSQNEGRTLETYLIHLKVERVKELISYGKWTLSEIAWKLKYSSVQYLSNQFKKVTGQTVTEYKKSGGSPRKTLDRI